MHDRFRTVCSHKQYDFANFDFDFALILSTSTLPVPHFDRVARDSECHNIRNSTCGLCPHFRMKNPTKMVRLGCLLEAERPDFRTMAPAQRYDSVLAPYPWSCPDHRPKNWRHCFRYDSVSIGYPWGRTDHPPEHRRYPFE